MRSLTFLRATLIGAALMGASSLGLADNLGLRGYPETWDATKPTVVSIGNPRVAPGLLSTNAVTAWNEFIPVVTQQVVQAVTVPNFAGQGFTLKNVRPQIAPVQSVEMRAAPVQDPLAPVGYQMPTSNAPVLVIHTVGSRIDAGSTTPYTSADTDPTFHVTFDLTAYVRLALGPRVEGIALSGAMVVVSNTVYTPDNATAKDAQALQPVLSALGLPEVAQKITTSLNGQVENIASYVAPAIRTANQALPALAPPNTNVIAGIFADSQWLNVVFTKRVQADSNGAINGTLTVSGLSAVPASQRTPPGNTNCTRAINLTDSVQVQADYVTGLNPLQIDKGSGPTVSLNSQLSVVGGTIQPTPDGWSCVYEVTGLASQVVNNLHFVEPGVAPNGGLPGVGYVVDVNFQGCSSSSVGGLQTSSATNCLRPGVCGDQLVPQSGGATNCSLIGTIQLSASAGVGVPKPSAFGSQAVNPVPGSVGSSVAPGVWGAQSVNRAVTPATTTTSAWGTPAAGSTPAGSVVAPGSALGRGSALQPRSMQAPTSVTPTASSAGSQF